MPYVTRWCKTNCIFSRAHAGSHLHIHFSLTKCSHYKVNSQNSKYYQMAHGRSRGQDSDAHIRSKPYKICPKLSVADNKKRTCR
uniref:Uncharacterized protein n=1 Tax=Arundo donax TaxID=35708 RepID=A0A0A8ZR95_ARUDO